MIRIPLLSSSLLPHMAVPTKKTASTPQAFLTTAGKDKQPCRKVNKIIRDVALTMDRDRK